MKSNLQGTKKSRSSHWQMFFKICLLKNFARFTGKHVCWNLFLIKLQASKAVTLLKRILQYRCLLVNIAKFLGRAYFIEHLRWLLVEKYVLEREEANVNHGL